MGAPAGTLITVALETIPPLSIVAARVGITTVVLLAHDQGLRLPTDAWTWRACSIQAALLTFVPFTLISWGQRIHNAWTITRVLHRLRPERVAVDAEAWRR